MKNFRMDYVYDGYKFWDVVAAETAEDAKEWFEHHDSDRRVYAVTETTEEATYTATAEDLEEIRTPYWVKRGATSEEELAAYCKYVNELDQKAYAEYYASHPDEDPEDFVYEVNEMTIEEWRAANK